MRAAFFRRPLSCRLSLQPPLRHVFSSSSAALNPDPTPEVHEPQQQQQPPRQQHQHHPQPDQPPIQQQQTQSQQQPPPLIYPTPSSASHHTDLTSFLAYAERTNLDPSSTVYIGTHFEYTAQLALARFGLDLRRVGGASDYGIDLLGTWTLPFPSSSSSAASSSSALPPSNSRPSPPPLRVLAQCKAVQRPGPHLVRELEGAFVGAPAGWRAWTGSSSSSGSSSGGGGGGVLGLLVAEKPATKGIREALARSRWPMGFVACSRAGEVSQLLWNRRAEEEGLEGFGVGVRYVDGGDGGLGGGGGKKELVLTWKGERVPFVNTKGMQ